MCNALCPITRFDEQHLDVVPATFFADLNGKDYNNKLTLSIKFEPDAEPTPVGAATLVAKASACGITRREFLEQIGDYADIPTIHFTSLIGVVDGRSFCASNNKDGNEWDDVSSFVEVLHKALPFTVD